MTIVELFLTRVLDGKVIRFEREVVEEIMGRDAVDPSSPLVDIEYADGGCELIGGDDDSIETLMFDHFGGETFFSRLWELANRTGAFLWWAGNGDGYAVTNRDVLEHLPPDIINSPKLPFVVRDGAALEEAIFDGTRPE